MISPQALRPCVPRPLALSLTLSLAISLSGPVLGQVSADLVLHNGRIVTLHDRHPEGRAIAILGDRVMAVGREGEIAAYIGEDTEVIDLQGALAIPGFIEGHGHFLGLGDTQLQLDLRGAETWDEIVALVAAAVEETEPGVLIRGRGWHQEKWVRRPSPDIDGLPIHTGLSSVSPENPVILTHASGHATYANAFAMDLCGISSETADPEGGQVVRDAEGNPIGVFRETASALLGRARLAAGPPDIQRQAELAVQECLSKGITSFQDAGSSFANVDHFKAMVDDGSLGVRLWVMLRESNAQLKKHIADYRIIRYGDSRLTVHAIKRSIDGALGSHGAWLLNPYADLPESSGLNTTSTDSIAETARIAIENDFQLCVHAIGDRANREVLDIFELTFFDYPKKTGLRWRMEHAQHLHPKDVPRFAILGVVASMQGIHCTSDAPWVYARLGAERAESGAYMWQSLMKAGVVVTNGTDAPVEDVDPIASYYASVSRKLADGSVFFADQRMTRVEALRSYTLNAAYAAFEEDIKGSLGPGKLADITVLSQDILSIEEDLIPATKVLYTIVGGLLMYQAPDDVEEETDR